MQRGPRTLQSVYADIGIPARGRAATRRDENVELLEGIGGRCLLVQARKVRAVTGFGRKMRVRPRSPEPRTAGWPQFFPSSLKNTS